MDRNVVKAVAEFDGKLSLSARRAWIEISAYALKNDIGVGRSPQGERG